MKFCVTPRAGDIAGIMQNGGIFEILIGHDAHPDHLIRLQAIEATLGDAADAITRLAALVAGTSNAARAVARRLRLSNAETDALAAAADVNLAGDAADCEDRSKAQLYRAGPVAFNRALRVAWARSGAPATDPAWTHKSLLVRRWSPPAMPFSGADILALGIPAGPRVGRTLKAFEAWWIEAGFPDDHAAQSDRLAALAKQS
jgi:poly(A) polymerase